MSCSTTRRSPRSRNGVRARSPSSRSCPGSARQSSTATARMCFVSSQAERFAELHAGAPFVIPNPWDVGSARVLESLGFPALATTSSGFAFTLGRPDGGATLEEVVEHVAAVVAAVDIPVSVDLENGYGRPDVAIRSVAGAGAAGASIEDWDPERGLY